MRTDASGPKIKVMIMGNHGVLILGKDVADTFNRLYYFERAAETYIRALQTGQYFGNCPMTSRQKPLPNLTIIQIKRKAIFLNSKQSWMKKVATTAPDYIAFKMYKFPNIVHHPFWN